MALKLTQGLKQTQNLQMTPQLQQAIKLLTLTHLEMTNMISDEMVENPMLEEIDDDGRPEKSADQDKVTQETAEADSSNFDEGPLIKKDDFDWNNYVDSYNANSSQAPSVRESASDEEAPNYENIISRGMDLFEHLEWQLRMDNHSEEDLQIADFIIHNLAHTGYIEGNYDELIQSGPFKKQDVERIRLIIQKLDPVGCASLDLADCLLAQAEVLEERSPLIEKIILKHLTDLQKKDYSKIAKEVGVSVEQVRASELFIQGLHPRPGRLVSNDETHYIVPDIFIAQVGDEFTVQVNDEGIPRLRISKLYQDLIRGGQQDAKAKEYVQEKLRSAMWLIKSIQNRQRTIMKVAKAMVARQQDFFKKGPKYLRPMILKDIADEIGMHESTVSRVTTNKFMHTPIGVYELKYFFNSGIGAEGGNEISGSVLKIKIKSLVDAENPKRPLSDQKIVELLARENITVARRTVAKYREILDIEPSSKRKKS